MKLRTLSYLLIITAAGILLGLFGVVQAQYRQSTSQTDTQLLIQARRPANQESSRDALPTPQVVMGTPEYYTPTATPEHYTYRNEFLEDRNKRLPLYLIDTETGTETRLGDDSAAAVFGVMNDRYLVWYSGGTHVYNLITGQDMLLSEINGSSIQAQLFDDWLAFGVYNGNGAPVATLYAANLQTQEIITLTRRLPAQNALVGGYFGISDRLAAWYEARNTMVVYDLISRHELARLHNIDTAFGKQNVTITSVSPGETVVTWSNIYGYDLVTQSYFRTEGKKPADWDGGLIRNVSRLQEKNRLLTWTYTMKDGTQRHVRAPLLDASPSTEPCIANQNLVQNGDLEATGDHALWQQTDNPSDLIVDEVPTGLATSGAWAIRLGRYANSHATIRQHIEVPSGVSGLTLTFDVRALSWGFWGGDRLQIDLVDPLTGHSLLATPVQWTNVQLASGDWLPMQIAIEDWPGINTPVELVFQVQTDWALPTDFVIDNIALTTTCQ